MYTLFFMKNCVMMNKILDFMKNCLMMSKTLDFVDFPILLVGICSCLLFGFSTVVPGVSK